MRKDRSELLDEICEGAGCLVDFPQQNQMRSASLQMKDWQLDLRQFCSYITGENGSGRVDHRSDWMTDPGISRSI